MNNCFRILVLRVDLLYSEDEQVTNSRRSWIIEQFTSLIKNGSIPKDDKWIQLVLDCLVVHGIFVVKKKSDKGSIPVCIRTQLLSFESRLRRI